VRHLPTPPFWALCVLTAALVIGLQLATVAACGPWDPWETHYGEVARQILARQDPLDLWWKPGYGPDGNAENTFWSKPALPFWLMALSMKLLGVGLGPEGEMVRSPWPELAIRLPSMLAGWLSAAFLGVVVWRLGQVPQASPEARRRAASAGLLTAFALSTMPQWAMVTRQALTDMFFVGPVTLAMGAWALAYLQPDRELRRRAFTLPGRLPLGLGGRALSLPWDRAHLAFTALFALAVVVPLAVLDHHVLSDVTRQRVAGFIKRPDVPNLYTLWQIHTHLLIYWALAALALLWSLRWRLRSQAWMGILYLAAGLSLLGKGLIGPGLIGLLVLTDMAIHGRLHLLRRAGLPLGVVLFALASFPWHHAMLLYRGDRFFNELIMVNNLARFGSGEQDQAVGGFTFYLRTLGIAALPWVAALPAALWRATGAGAEASRGPRGELERFAFLWLAVSLLLITYSVTKYYHYLLPALPPLAVLLGLALAAGLDAPGRAWLAARPRARWLAAGLGAAILVLTVRDAVVEPAWITHLTTYLYTAMWREGAPPVEVLGVLVLPFVLGLALWASLRPRLAIASMAASSLAVSAWLFTSYLPHVSETWSQRSAIRHYFDHRAPGDRLLSYWFYYRGETFFTKADVWVAKEAKRDKLAELIEEEAGEAQSLWLVTTLSHGKRVITTLPHAVRGGVEWAYQNPHYALLRIPLPPPPAE